MEVEAYRGPEDRASHARAGETPRNRVMFGPPGIAYVYLVYGMHDCLNVVTEHAGTPAALLIRAIAPLEGADRMRIDRILRATSRRRDVTTEAVAASADRLSRLPVDRLASGPGLVTAAFGIDTGWSGMDLCDTDSPLRLEERTETDPSPVVAATARIGIDHAGPTWAAKPWRFVEVGHPSVSGPPVRG